MIKEVQAAGFTLAEFKELDEACNAADGLVSPRRQQRFFDERLLLLVRKSRNWSEFKHISPANWQKCFSKTMHLRKYRPLHPFLRVD